jgi:hypothetical protein
MTEVGVVDIVWETEILREELGKSWEILGDQFGRSQIHGIQPMRLDVKDSLQRIAGWLNWKAWSSHIKARKANKASP